MCVFLECPQVLWHLDVFQKSVIKDIAAAGSSML